MRKFLFFITIITSHYCVEGIESTNTHKKINSNSDRLQQRQKRSSDIPTHVVKCNDASYVVSWLKATWGENADNIAITLRDPRCSAYSSNSTHVWVERGLDECGSTNSTTSETITFTNTAVVKVRKVVRPLVYGETTQSYTVACTMDRSKTSGTSGLGVREKPIEVTIPETNDLGPIIVHMALNVYKDNSFTTLAPIPLLVKQSDHIHLEAGRVKGSGNESVYDNRYKFIVNTCYKTPTSDPSDENVDYVLFEKCPLLDPFDIDTDDKNNEYFRFVVYTETLMPYIAVQNIVYFHCIVDVCALNSTSYKCLQKCDPSEMNNNNNNNNNGNNNNDNNNNNNDDNNDPNGNSNSNLIAIENGNSNNRAENNNNNSPLTRITLTSSPVKFNPTPEVVSCSRKICPVNSTCVELDVATCVCDEGFVLSRNSSTCAPLVREREVPVQGIRVNRQWKDEYANTSSKEFTKLAQEYEEAAFRLIKATNHDDKIEGVKVTRIYQGSIVFDFILIHAEQTTQTEAYEAFVQSTLGKSADPQKETTEDSSNSFLMSLQPLRDHYKIMGDFAPAPPPSPTDNTTHENDWFIPVAIVLAACIVLFLLMIAMITVRRRLGSDHLAEHTRNDDVIIQDDGIAIISHVRWVAPTF